MSTGLKKITVVPHYLRLHEWIALEEGFYQAEGLDPVLRDDIMLRSLMDEDPTHGRGELPDYEEGTACASSACEWGVIRNAGAGKGKVLTDLYSVAPFAIYTRPDSDIHRLTDLRDRPVGVMLRSGTHFTTLKVLEGCMPRERVNIKATGGAGLRLKALTDGDIDAATLLDPERGVAEQMGMRKLAMGEFRVLFYVSEGMPPALVRPYVETLRRADTALRENPQKYLHLWDRNVRPEVRGKVDYQKFGVGELLFFETYPEDVFQESMEFAKRWGVTGDVVNESYRELTTATM